MNHCFARRSKRKFALSEVYYSVKLLHSNCASQSSRRSKVPYLGDALRCFGALPLFAPLQIDEVQQLR